MGRDVTGLRIDKKPNIAAKPKGINHVTVSVGPKIEAERVGTNDSEMEDHSVKGTMVEDAHEKQDILGVKSTNYYPGLPDAKIQKAETLKPIEKKLMSQVKPASGSAATEMFQTSPHVPTTPSLATTKQNLGTSDNGAEPLASILIGGDKTDDSYSSVTKKTSQPTSPISMKTMQPDYEKYHDEEDNYSVASSTSIQTAKSRVTVGVAPKFSCVERLERRKEYYSKLEKKHKALEQEKLEYAARTKEEENTAIKQLRKSMVYKANPVPSFYHEGPPPKVQLKKLPVTRAKSPKLTRRKSCSDAPKSSTPETGICDHAKRHSIGVYKIAKCSLTPSTLKNKDVSLGRNSVAAKQGSLTCTATRNRNTPGKQNCNHAKKLKDQAKQVKETSKISCTPEEQSCPDVSVIEEVKNPNTVAEHVTDKAVVEEKNKTPQLIIGQMSNDITMEEEATETSPPKKEQNSTDITAET